MTLRNTALLAILMACAFIVVGQLYLTIPLVADIADRFTTTQSNAALAGSAFGFAYALGFLVFGPLSDRYGRRNVLVSGLLATAAASFLVSMAPTFPLFLSARALQGFTAATFPPAALSLVAETLPPEQRPFGVSLMSFAFLGAAPLAQFFAVQAGGSVTGIMVELAPLYLVGAFGLLLTTPGNAGKSPSSTTPNGGQFISLLQDRAILAAWAAACTVLFGFVAYHTALQASSTSIGADLQVIRLAGLPPLLMTFAAAPLTHRFGAPVTAGAGLVVAAISFGVAMIGDGPFFIAASALLAGGVALAVPGLIATIASRATNSNRGLGLAIYSFALFLGASLAPPVAQAVAEHSKAVLWLLCAALLLAAVAGLIFARSLHPATATEEFQ